MGSGAMYDDGRTALDGDGVTLLVVLDLDGRVKPGFTPDDPDQVLEMLARRAPAN